MIKSIRVVTYNTHKCRGLDGRLRPDRIVDVLREVDGDIIALQEVLSVENGTPESHQARFIASELGFEFALGENRRLRGGAYGNVVLSRFPIRRMRNYDLSQAGREERGCLRADLEITGAHALHVFNVHLGTAFDERRHQGRIIAGELLTDVRITAPRIVFGDFNEWTRGLATRLLSTELESVDVSKHLQRSKTYPGLLPFLHLDHIYYDPLLTLERLALHRSRKALVSSDHLPLVADFRLPEGNGHHH